MVKASALVARANGSAHRDQRRAQDVFYPGNGVDAPTTVVKEIHLMGATDAKVGIDYRGDYEDGTVTDVSVAASPDSRLSEAAVRALRQWQFKPGTKGGQPVWVQDLSGSDGHAGIGHVPATIQRAR